jgi:Fe-S-cluster-containing dehydrogenase component
VRRFNWFDWLGADSFFTGTLVENLKDPYDLTSDLTRMVLNPDVTVRSRGVMEKCSFCVQRLQEGKLAAKKEGRKLRDKEIKTACMQACPTHAISFGDYNDKASEVRKQLDEDKRTFFVIEEINTDPSIGYQAKIRNRSLAENAERRGIANEEQHA